MSEWLSCLIWVFGFCVWVDLGIVRHTGKLVLRSDGVIRLIFVVFVGEEREEERGELAVPSHSSYTHGEVGLFRGVPVSRPIHGQ